MGIGGMNRCQEGVYIAFPQDRPVISIKIDMIRPDIRGLWSILGRRGEGSDE